MLERIEVLLQGIISTEKSSVSTTDISKVIEKSSDHRKPTITDGLEWKPIPKPTIGEKINEITGEKVNESTDGGSSSKTSSSSSKTITDGVALPRLRAAPPRLSA